MGKPGNKNQSRHSNIFTRIPGANDASTSRFTAPKIEGLKSVYQDKGHPGDTKDEHPHPKETPKEETTFTPTYHVTNKKYESDVRSFNAKELKESVDGPLGEIFTEDSIKTLFGTTDKVGREFATLNYGKYTGMGLFTEEVNSVGNYTLIPSKSNIRNYDTHKKSVNYIQKLNPAKTSHIL